MSNEPTRPNLLQQEAKMNLRGIGFQPVGQPDRLEACPTSQTMNEFIHDEFLLKTASARRLYHELAAGLPIIDYHSRLDLRELADDRQFANLSQLWIASDPYKHRAMRIASVPERLIIGDATDREKFDAWAASCATGWATTYKPARCPTRTNSSARWCAASVMITLTVGCFPKEPCQTNRLDF